MKIFQGKIVSNKNNKTLIIEVERLFSKPDEVKKVKIVAGVIKKE